MTITIYFFDFQRCFYLARWHKDAVISLSRSGDHDMAAQAEGLARGYTFLAFELLDQERGERAAR